MRAYRMLTILLLLQSRGQVTARELADRLEVSQRTIYRDLEALSSAGAPVYAERGSGGGWRMLEGAGPDVPGLDEAQVRALLLGGRRDLQEDLGLRGAAELVWARLEEAIGPRDQPVDDLLLVDSPSWRGRRDEVASLPVIQQAVFRGRRLQMLYARDGEPVQRVVDPLGLVVKGSNWYLVAAVDGQPRTYRVSRVLEATTLPERASRPDGFRLREWWDAQQRDFVERLPRFPVQAMVRGEPLDGLSRVGWYATIEHQSEPDAKGFRVVDVAFQAEHHALGWAFSGGADVIVIEPAELRARLVQYAGVVLRQYGDPALSS
ncbi:MAG TPA: YafY family protein [Thermomicrobiales bacterium]|nr:YafY family protein [Thermomicrobiales bacterium]